jgi:YD repeat-containing protein
MKRLLGGLMLIASGVFTQGAYAACVNNNLLGPESGASILVVAYLGQDPCDQYATTVSGAETENYTAGPKTATHTGGVYHGTSVVNVVRHYSAKASRSSLQVTSSGNAEDIDAYSSFGQNQSEARAAEVFTVTIAGTGTTEIPVEFCSYYSTPGKDGGNYNYAVSSVGISLVRVSGTGWATFTWDSGSGASVTHAYQYGSWPKDKCNQGKVSISGSGVFKIKGSVTTTGRGNIIEKPNYAFSYQGSTTAWLSIKAHDVPCTSTSGNAAGCELASIENSDRVIPDYPYRNSPIDCTLVGNPIDVALGYKYQNENDYSNGVLSLNRIYRSDSVWTNNTFGALWRHNFARTFVTKTISNVNYIDITDGSGARREFVASGGNWVPVYADITAKLESVSGGYKYTLPDEMVEIYNNSGELTRIVYSGGGAVNLSYTSGKLSSVTDEQGRSITFAYTGSRVTQVTTPTGNFNYYYDGNGNLIQITKPDTKTRFYHYENASFLNALTGITDELGVRYATYAYDTQGRAISSSHAGGLDTYTVSYGSDGVTTVTNPLGKQTKYHFETILGVKKIVKVEGVQTPNCAAANKFSTYNADGFLTSKTDWELNQTSFDYDSQKRVNSIIEGNESLQERSTAITYVNASKRLVDTITRQNLVTDYDYDSFDRITKVTMTDTGSSTARIYNYAYFSNTTDGGGNTVLGKLQTYTDARGNATSFTYDPNGDLKTVTNAKGHVWTIYARDSVSGRITEILDPNGTKDKIEYDALGRMTKYTQANNRSAPVKGATIYAYNADGTLYMTTLANGVYLKNFYNAAGYIDKINNSDSGEYYTLDAAGNVTETKRKKINGSTIDYRFFADFDDLSRVISTHHNSDDTFYQYDLNGNVNKVTDGNGFYSTYTYDALERVASVTDRMNGQSQYSYNALDQLTGAGFTSSTNSKGNSYSVSLSTTYTYNAFDDVLSETSPDRGVTSYQVDAAGNVTQRTDAAGRVANYAYDVLNRLISITYPNDGNLNVTLTYDTTSGCGASKGRLCSVYSPSFGTTSYV